MDAAQRREKELVDWTTGSIARWEMNDVIAAADCFL